MMNNEIATEKILGQFKNSATNCSQCKRYFRSLNGNDCLQGLFKRFVSVVKSVIFQIILFQQLILTFDMT